MRHELPGVRVRAACADLPRELRYGELRITAYGGTKSVVHIAAAQIRDGKHANCSMQCRTQMRSREASVGGRKERLLVMITMEQFSHEHARSRSCPALLRSSRSLAACTISDWDTWLQLKETSEKVPTTRRQCKPYCGRESPPLWLEHTHCAAHGRWVQHFLLKVWNIKIEEKLYVPVPSVLVLY